MKPLIEIQNIKWGRRSHLKLGPGILITEKLEDLELYRHTRIEDVRINRDVDENVEVYYSIGLIGEDIPFFYQAYDELYEQWIEETGNEDERIKVNKNKLP